MAAASLRPRSPQSPHWRLRLRPRLLVAIPCTLGCALIASSSVPPGHAAAGPTITSFTPTRREIASPNVVTKWLIGSLGPENSEPIAHLQLDTQRRKLWSLTRSGKLVSWSAADLTLKAFHQLRTDPVLHFEAEGDRIRLFRASSIHHFRVQANGIDRHGLRILFQQWLATSSWGRFYTGAGHRNVIVESSRRPSVSIPLGFPLVSLVPSQRHPAFAVFGSTKEELLVAKRGDKAAFSLDAGLGKTLSSPIWSIAWHPAGTSFAVGQQNGEVTEYALVTGRWSCTSTWNCGKSEAPVKAVTYRPKTNEVYALTDEGVWLIKRGSTVCQKVSPLDEEPSVSPALVWADANILCIASDDWIRVLQLNGGTPDIHEIQEGKSPVVWDPGGKRFISASSNPKYALVAFSLSQRR